MKMGVLSTKCLKESTYFFPASRLNSPKPVPHVLVEISSVQTHLSHTTGHGDFSINRGRPHKTCHAYHITPLMILPHEFYPAREGEKERDMKKLLSSPVATFALVLLLLLGMWLQPNEARRMLIKGKDEGGGRGGGAAWATYRPSGLLAFQILQKGPVSDPGNPCHYAARGCKPPKGKNGRGEGV